MLTEVDLEANTQSNPVSLCQVHLGLSRRKPSTQLSILNFSMKVGHLKSEFGLRFLMMYIHSHNRCLLDAHGVQGLDVGGWNTKPSVEV